MSMTHCTSGSRPVRGRIGGRWRRRSASYCGSPSRIRMPRRRRASQHWRSACLVGSTGLTSICPRAVWRQGVRRRIGPSLYTSEETVTAKDRTQCTYCPEAATTDDHVPPQCLYTRPLPSNLVTVPACATCNNGASKDDAEFRNHLSIMSGSFGGSANAAERLKPSLRAVRRDRPTLERMVLGAHPIERYSAGGIYLGCGVAVTLPPDARERVLLRIVRGLFWYHFDEPLDAARVRLIHIDKSKPTWWQALDELLSVPHHHVLVGNGETFEYRYSRDADNAVSFWMMTFFRGPSEYIVIGHTLPS